MRGALLAVLAAASGCNAIFGLDPVVTTEVDTGVDAVVDRDGDGVRDDADLCPDVADPRQHDEDSDGVGDLCDNCPHLANADQAEVLEGAGPDGIGDACDPNPDTGGDVVRAFDAFDDAALDPRWVVITGDAWTERDDALVQATGTGVHVLALPDVSSPQLTVEVAVTITSSEPTLQRGFHLGIDYVSEQSAVLCIWRSLASANAGEALVLELLPAGPVQLAMATGPAIVAPSTQRLRARRTLTGTTAGIRCELVAQSNLATPTTVGPGGVALRLNNLGVRVEYLMVYDRAQAKALGRTD